MKNNKGFTLIELIAVVVILAVLMMLAVPNVVATINKNKKEAFLEDAKKFRAAVEAKLVSDTSIKLPNADSVIVFTLDKVGKVEIEESPYGTKYSTKYSFVAVTKQPKEVVVNDPSGTHRITSNELTYYVHLVTCATDDCSDSSVESRYGLNLRTVDDLNTSQRFNYIVQADSVVIPNNIPEYVNTVLPGKTVNVYSK
jgi:type IV pilus assembly protein PilA